MSLAGSGGPAGIKPPQQVDLGDRLSRSCMFSYRNVHTQLVLALR